MSTTSTLIAIADAVVATLNAGSFSQAFTAARFYQPHFDLPEMKNLHVSVVPKAIEILVASRSQSQHDYLIDIGIQKRVVNDAEMDGLMALVEEIADSLRLNRIDVGTIGMVPVVKVTNEPVFAPEHLNEKRLFTAVVTVTFRVLRI